MTGQKISTLPLDASYKFYAFISYSHSDEPFVKKLQEKIESYRLPSSLHQLKEGLPDKLHPLFRDATDLPPGQLSEEIRKKLAESNYLIVICSPHSAGSYWVEKEIEEFERQGRHDHIIPVIIDGAVNALDEAGRPDPSRECFPKPLLEEVRQGLDRQLLGVSVPADGQRKAILKVIAKMLQLDPDDLITRDQVRERKRKRNLAVAFSTLFLLILAAFLYYWDYQREKISYYADYVDEWGLPSGLFKLDADEAAQRNSYRFTSQRRKLKEVVHVDSFGQPVPHQDPQFIDRPVFQTFAYEDNSGRLIETKYLDRNRNLLMRLVFSGDRYTAIDFKRVNSENETLQAALAAQTSSAADGQLAYGTSSRFGYEMGGVRGQVQRWQVSRDEKGHISGIKYKQLESSRAAKDKDGIFGQALSLDEYGRVIKRVYLDAEGRNYSTPEGLAGKSYRYNGANLVEIINLDAQNQPVADDRQQIIISFSFDEHGRKTQQSSLDGNRVLYPDQDGVAQKKWKYDSAGRTVEEAYFGIDETPWLISGGYAGWKMSYNGLRRDKSFFGQDGSLSADKFGVAKIVELIDEKGNFLERSRYGMDGRPVVGADGLFKEVYRYDGLGRLVEESFFGPDEQATAGSQGYARALKIFNDFGLIAEESFFGADGQPVLNNEGAAKVIYDYDERGTAEAVTYFGVNGQRVTNRDGYSQMRFKTDIFGRPLTVAFYGPDDKPAVNSAFGYARSETTWNELNLMTEIRFFDADGKLCDPAGGLVAGIRFEYDREGRPAGSAMINLNGEIGQIIPRSEPESVETSEEGSSVESIPVAIKPSFVNFGSFSGKIQTELTIYNLTANEVIMSNGVSGNFIISTEFPDGQFIPPRGTIRLIISCAPPANKGGRLDGSAVFLQAGILEQPPLIVPILGQYNVELLSEDDGTVPNSRIVPIIYYNPDQNKTDHFEYASIAIDAQDLLLNNPDGSQTRQIIDQQGRVIEATDYDSKGRKKAWQYYVYENNGKHPVSSSRIATDGAVVDFYYNDAGEIDRMEEFKAP